MQLSRATPAILPTVAVAEVAAAPVPDAVVRYCSTFAPIPIPDGSGTVATGSVMVPEAATILDANVQISVTHTWIGDLIIQVSNGTSAPVVVNRPLLVASPPDGCGGDHIMGSYGDDEGMDGTWEESCINGKPAYPANSRMIGGDPANKSLMSVFDGGSTAGTWSLSVSDHLPGDTGTLDGFCMEFTIPGGNPTATATITPTPIPPSATLTNTPIPFTATPTPTGTFIPPTHTHTATAVPTIPTATPLPTSTGTPFTATPIPSATPSPTGTIVPASPTTMPPDTPTLTATGAPTTPVPPERLHLPLVQRLS